MTTTIIDGKAFPFVPEGWSVIEHKSFGEVSLKDGKLHGFSLLYAPCQSSFIPPVCDEIEKEVTEASVPVLNANILDYLLEHPDAVPENITEVIKNDSTKKYGGGCVWFWGTKYKNKDGYRCVRGLCLGDKETLEWGSVNIDHDGLLGDPMILHDWFKPPT